jgi:hypothetical protein
MRLQPRPLIPVLAFCLACVLSPVKAEQEYDAEALQRVETITLLPVLLPADIEVEDRRQFESAIFKELSRNLALKGYVLDKPRNWAQADDWTYENLASMTPQQIAALAPGNSNYFTLGFIHSADSSSFVIWSSAKASIAAFVVERDSGNIVWKNEESSEYIESWFSMPLWLMAMTDDKLFAVAKGFIELFEDMPEKGY